MSKPTLTLDHTPGEWDGTFAIVLRCLIDDLLSDGAPFEATVTWHDGRSRRELTTLVRRRVEQDAAGVWTTPNGDRIAWFTDPDANNLSVTQFA